MLEELLSLDPTEWHGGQMIALDWYDGPRKGFCRLARPAVEFYFTLLDERRDPDGQDDRLFAVYALPLGAGEQLDWTDWHPHNADALIGSATPTDIVVYAKDMSHFLGCWRVPEEQRPADNWFAHLGI